jgi:hypothetical protein
MFSGSAIAELSWSAVPIGYSPTPEGRFIDGVVSWPLTWIELHNEDPRAFAEVDLNDRSSYYLGFKAATVLSWAKVTRGLSDHQGTLEHLAYGCTFSDTTRYFRGLLDDVSVPAAATRFLTNRPTVERMIDDDQRRVEGIPRVIANGFINDYEPLGGLKFRVSCADWIRRKGTRSRKSFQKWQPLVLPVDFDVNTTPQGVLNKPAPVIYGSLSSSTGAFAPIYTGIRLCSDAVDRSEFLIAAHACIGIPSDDEVYIDDVQVSAPDLAADWILPNTAAFIALFGQGYAEFNGRRYTTMYVTRAQAIALNLVTADELGPGTARLTINIDGIETVGDCTGTVITSLVQQCQHFAENPGDRPWNAQGWANDSPLTFSAISGLTLVDRESFALVDASVNLTGTGVIGFGGEAVGVLDVLARFCLNGDFQLGINRKGQLIAAYEPETEPDDLSSVNDVTNILADSLSIRDDVSSRFWNIQPYRYGEDYSGKTTGEPIFVNGVRIVPPNSERWQSVLDGNIEIRDATSIANYDQEIEGPSLDFHFLRSATDALAVAGRRLNRYLNPLRTVTFTVPLSGTSIDLGDLFTLSAIDGMTATGWTDRPLRCVRHELDPNANTVTIEAYDLRRVVATRTLGDETDDTAEVLGDETDGSAMVLH